LRLNLAIEAQVIDHVVELLLSRDAGALRLKARIAVVIVVVIGFSDLKVVVKSS